MFTETELREALEHSAARADDVEIATPTTPSRRWLLPLAAAATVAALAVGVVAFVGGRADNPPPVGGPEAGATVELVDRAVAGVDAEYSFTDVSVRATGGQHISRALGPKAGDGTVGLAVLPGASLDRDRVERGRKVVIDGRTGWFAQRTWFELDGQEGAAPGQDDPLPQWTIAFRTPDDDWAFASIATVEPSGASDGTYDDTTVEDAGKVVAAYESLKIRWQRNGARQPLRLGVLPAGLRVHDAGYSVRGGRVVLEQIRLVERDDTAIQIRWSARGNRLGDFGSACSGDPATTLNCTIASRTLPAGTVHVDAFGAYKTESVTVLDGITAATNPADYVGFEQAVTP